MGKIGQRRTVEEGLVKSKWIAVRPRNFRSIALRAISQAAQPVVLVNGKISGDFSETGPLTRGGIRSIVDLEIRDGAVPIMGFHDHPNEMWISSNYADLAEYCAKVGWLDTEFVG